LIFDTEIEIKFSLEDATYTEKNVIFEYDEKRHEFEDKKIKDIKRIRYLINKLNCVVIRYSEKFKRLYHSNPIYSELIL